MCLCVCVRGGVLETASYDPVGMTTAHLCPASPDTESDGAFCLSQQSHPLTVRSVHQGHTVHLHTPAFPLLL